MRYLQIVLILIPLLAMGIIFSGCAGKKTSAPYAKVPPFQIKDVSSQPYTSGIKDGRTGENVTIIFSDIDPSVQFEHLYYKGDQYRLEKSVQDENTFVSRATRNDMVMDKNPVKEAQNTPPFYPKNIQDGEAVISYLYQGVLQYYKISDVSVKERINYPTSQPPVSH